MKMFRHQTRMAERAKELLDAYEETGDLATYLRKYGELCGNYARYGYYRHAVLVDTTTEEITRRATEKLVEEVKQ